MKYGSEMVEKMRPEWSIYYMDYHQLKMVLKEKSSAWTDADDATFKKAITTEANRVAGFVRDRVTQATNTMRLLEHQFQQWLKCGSDAPKSIDELARKVMDLVFYLYDSTQFLHVNKTGFDKIIKKHDRYTSYILSTDHVTIVRPLVQYANALDALYIRVANLFDACHLQKKRAMGGTVDASMSSFAQNTTPASRNHAFVAHSTLFWIHPDHIDEVRALLLLYLSPLAPCGTDALTHPANQRFHADFQTMRDHYQFTHVYWDTDDMDLYNRHVALCNEKGGGSGTHMFHATEAKNDSDALLMLKHEWLGKTQFTMSIERQSKAASSHRPIRKVATMTTSTIDSLRTQHSALFATFGDAAATTTSAAGAASHASDGAGDDNDQVLHQCIAQEKLVPKCIVRGQRYSFGTADLVLDLDVHMSMDRARQPSSAEPFPFAQLTIYTRNHRPWPWWLQRLAQSHLLYGVDRFSMFAHATSQVYRTKRHTLSALPWWIHLLDKDIRKPQPHQQQQHNDVGLARTADGNHTVFGHRIASFDLASRDFVQPAIQSLAATHHSLRRPRKPSHTSIPLIDTTNVHTPPAILPSANASPGSMSWWMAVWRQQRYQQQRLASSTSSTTLAALHHNQALVMPPPSSARSIQSMFGKPKVTNPKLTEPKTFFANERTFISWLQFAGILLTIALFLFNKQDALSRWMGLALMCLTLISTFYALIRFQYRSWHLRKERSVVRYDDVTGPTCLCILLVSAMVINFYLRIISQ